MDNASIHMSIGLQHMVEAQKVLFTYTFYYIIDQLFLQWNAASFLTPYSPDMNPIEEAFSAIKAWIQANWDYAHSELSGNVTCDPYRLLWDAVFETVTPAKAAGWFHHCSYM